MTWESHEELIHAVDQMRHHIKNMEQIATRVNDALPEGHDLFSRVIEHAGDAKTVTTRIVDKLRDIHLKSQR